MKFACFTAALLSVIVQEKAVNAIELGSHHQHDDFEIDASQTWTEVGPEDMVEDYFVQSDALKEDKKKKPKSKKDAIAANDAKKAEKKVLNENLEQGKGKYRRLKRQNRAHCIPKAKSILTDFYYIL